MPRDPEGNRANPDPATTGRQQEGQTISSRFGFRHVLSTEERSAPWFVGAALGLDVLGSFSIAGQMFMIGRPAVEAGGGWPAWPWTNCGTTPG